MSEQQIKKLALANGFKLKEQADGNMDLNPYAYDFARALVQTAQQQKKIEQLQVEVDRLKSTALPTELTPVIKSVLGMMCFQIGHYAHVYQAAGFDIPKKAEEEQAFCLHRWLLAALEYGENWPRVVQEEIEDLAAKAKEQSHD